MRWKITRSRRAPHRRRRRRRRGARGGQREGRRRHVARAPRVHCGHQRVAEPAVHDRVPRRRRARRSATSRPTRRSGWRRGWKTRSDDARLVLVAGRRSHATVARQGGQGARRPSSVRRPSRPPACSAAELKDAGIKLDSDASSNSSHISARTRVASPSWSRCSTRRTAAARPSTSTTSRRTSATSAPPVASIS